MNSEAVLLDRDQFASAADYAYAALRKEIVEGRFPPGRRMREIELAQLLGISRTPTRQALSRLELEGLAAAAFLTGASSSAAPSATEGDTAGAAVAVAFLVVTVFAATVLVAVRLAGLFAATLFRVRLGSAALTISVTPSSSRIWLRLRSTFFH